jgi:gluconate 5-dehydrogenase
MEHLKALFSLTGKVALVTGASSGLGSQTARALAKAGADVGLVARRRDQLEHVASELAELGVRACVAPADVTQTGEITRALERIEAELGPVDILVNGAGIAPLGRTERHSREKWDLAIAVNLTSAFELSQLVGQRMIARGCAGRIIQLSSVVGIGGNPVYRVIGYAASKGGLNGLTRQLAVEWARHGITVNAIAPAYFPTGMTIDPRYGEVAREHRERMETFTPMARLGRTGELDTAVLFLASPASSYVTGILLPVDGGWSAW